MKSSIDQLKLELISGKSQIVLFRKNGELVDTCHTLLQIDSKKSLYEQFNFLLSIKEVLQNLGQEPLHFELIEWEEQTSGLFSLRFQTLEEDLIQWTILDRTADREQILSVQQARNDEAIGKELATLREKYLQSEKEFLEFRNAELKRIQQFKERFFAEVSHEMRTPLNSITGLVKLLEWSEPKDQYDYLHALKSTSEHLNHIINDVLDLSKLEEGKLQLEAISFDLNEIAQAIMKGFDLVAREKNLELKIQIDKSIPELIIADPVRLSQVLYNLIGNAIKFTHEGSVMLQIDQIKQEGSDHHLRINVSDTGIGMPQESIDKILEPYAQAEGQSNAIYGGTGLGMGVAHKLIQAFGSELQIESEPGKGTKMCFSIHAQTGKHLQYSVNDHYDPTAQVNINQYKFLFAEDDEMSQLIMKERSLKWNLNSTFVSNVKDLSRQLEQCPYDILISDLHLDELVLSEIQALRRSKSVNAQIPIVFISGDSQDMHPELQELEGWAYLVKPVNPRLLSLKIRELLGIMSNNQMEEVDLSQLKRSVPDSPEFLLELIDTILENLPIDIEKFGAALAQDDVETAKKVLHKMKPSIAYLGIPSLSQERDQIFEKLKEGDEVSGEVQIFKSRVNLALEDLALKKQNIKP